MSKKIIIAFALGVILTMLMLYGIATAIYASNNPYHPTKNKVAKKESDTKKLLRLINTERALRGIQIFKIDKRLNASALGKSKDMYTREYMAHKDPESGEDNGIDMAIKKLNNIAGTFGENLYIGTLDYDSPEQALKWWKGSKPHWKAILDPRYTLAGVGIYKGYYTLHMYSPEKI